MRLFVAVDVPDAVKAAVEDGIVGVLRPVLHGARWTRPEGRHLTLRFLGEVDETRMPAVSGVLAASAGRHGRFEAAFAEVGGFPTLRRPRVLWAGVGEGASELGALAAEVESGLEPLGFVPESRPFTAHVTLARFPRPRVIDRMPDVDVPADRFAVDEVVLFRSQLHPKGARYTALERFPLAGGVSL